MLRFLLAPRWLALHVAVVAAVAGTMVLGSWQMRSYAEQERREQVAARNQQADAPSVPVEQALATGEPLVRDAVGRPVTLTGSYDGDQTLLLAGRERDGVVGWYVVTPLVAEDGSATPVLRGWVPSADDPAAAAPTGGMSVRGLLQPLETDAAAAIDPTQPLPDGQAAALTSVVLFQSVPYPPATVRQALVVLTDEQPAPAVAPEPVPVAEAAPRPVGVSAWRHLSYAWQWWLFALAAVVFWGAFVRAGIRDEREQAAHSEQTEQTEQTGQSASATSDRSHQGLP